MAGLNIGSLATGPYATLAILVVVAVVTMIIVWSSPAEKVECPKELRRNAHGELRMHPGTRTFTDMNAFQNWWYSVGLNKRCPLPILVGPTKEVVVSRKDDYTEQTYAKTPINKVDDYELSRVFGVQQGDEMVINQDLNKILLDRKTDWADRPISSDERKGSYRGLKEGFTADGDLTSEATAQYGSVEVTEDSDCKLSRDAKKVARLVEKVYEEDKDYEPVVTQVGPNRWEVNELKPRYRKDEGGEKEKDRVVDTNNHAVKVGYRYPDQEALDSATDPYFKNGGWKDPREYKDGADPYHGVVPNMARMFGPTFDNQDWTNSSPV